MLRRVLGVPERRVPTGTRRRAHRRHVASRRALNVDAREVRLEGKPQRERVAATDPHDRGCDLVVLDPGGPHDLSNAFVVERSEWKDLETSELAALDRPLEHRGLSSRDHDPYRAPEAWKHLVAQPRIRDPEHLIVVDDDDGGVHPAGR